MLPEICKGILVREGVQIGDEMPLAQLIRELEGAKPEAAALVIRFKNHSEACKMLQSDHEMRYKIPDIWRMQLEMSKSELKKSHGALSEYLIKNGFEQLADAYLPEI